MSGTALVKESYEIYRTESYSTSSNLYNIETNFYEFDGIYYCIFVDNEHTETYGSTDHAIFMYKSTDSGQTWDRLPSFSFPNDGTLVHIGAGGRLGFCVYDSKIYVSVFADYRTSFFNPHDSYLFCYIYDGDSWTYSQVVADRLLYTAGFMHKDIMIYDGNLYIILDASRTSQGEHHVFESTNNGLTWSKHQLIGTTGRERYGTTMDSNGVIWFIFPTAYDATPYMSKFDTTTSTFYLDEIEIPDGERYIKQYTNQYYYANPNIIFGDGYTLIVGSEDVVDSDDKLLVYKLVDGNSFEQVFYDVVGTPLTGFASDDQLAMASHYISGNTIYYGFTLKHENTPGVADYEIRALYSNDMGVTWEVYSYDTVRIHEGNVETLGNAIANYLRIHKYTDGTYYGVLLYDRVAPDDEDKNIRVIEYLSVQVVATPTVTPIPEATEPQLKFPRFKPVEITNEKPQTIADAFVELNRNLDWMFKSLNESIIRLEDE